jgi:hypothetical protein
MYTQNQNQQVVQDKIFSKMLRAGSKNYFFDIKQASNGSNYLTISESYKNKEGAQVTNRLMIFKDHAKDFITTFAEAETYLQ